MPYFFILPVFILLVLALLATGIVLRFTRWKRLARFAFGAALGAVLGFVGANAALGLVLYAAGRLMTGRQPLPAVPPGIPSVLAGLAGVAALVLVPLAVSTVGTAVGAAAGMFAAWRFGRTQK